ncbi:mannose-1-phosphate guanylyltransferase [Tenacibaculum finnmarkense genomovar finnmarkense]|uniref:mannose-1-phosphate guanylyltransferase n=1 Tax=Tenacibaculum finnmarkense TaxID=2781243 RepID=UPI001E305EBB|nr:mannose-1-phosphate guanylyltransferase [Tenacibaculum finnmarkense]MCD8417716.1 mannose-1-phosphate guanylyltransferase [Tenacibaculum finnmarkense genomovar finnmarkense]MCG8186035.1 mannose-1-phosphate guanylyltransferase [Tenacibaculum finnmarkense genomovar finnmarkense]MCG8202587.1 mannose-1-phosphate guanylyltransferase [Tenacibaculum finnmarkense genomovar finnmarkense]MCG8209982.1 mannose-1-phosphate guanylyltransferase [Tenacibaculum finnmarkense genomovar finnmarkense]MCG8212855.
MNNNYYAVIMAGGVGSRFWPVSTQEYPKQFHDILGTGESLIQRTFNRINQLIPAQNILISTNECYQELVLKQLSKTSKQQLLLEPTMRNTAPCILYAALKIYAQNPDAVLLIAPSDHWIEDEIEFLKNIKTSFEASEKNDILMTLGIEPDAPNTGYGYIKFEENSLEDSGVKKVKNFTEKPNLKTAKEFLKSGDYLWNAGIFIWSAKSILKAFKEHLPEMFAVLNTDKKVYNTDLEADFIKKNYEKCENISIDYGIMEPSNNVHTLPVNFGWNDLGTWGSLYNKLAKDSQQNAVVGANAVFKDASGNMIRTQSGKKIIVQGLNDFIIVEKDDVILICPKKDEQDIKQISALATAEFSKLN